MKKLREEIEQARKDMLEAFRVYTKKSTQINYNEYVARLRYYEGLKRAFDLIEGE